MLVQMKVCPQSCARWALAHNYHYIEVERYRKASLRQSRGIEDLFCLLVGMRHGLAAQEAGGGYEPRLRIGSLHAKLTNRSACSRHGLV